MDSPAPPQPVFVPHLRAAVADDALCLSVLAMQVFLDTYATQGIRVAIAREVLAAYSQAAFLQAIAVPGSRLAVAESAGHLVGFAQVTLGQGHALAPDGSPAELLRLYVQEPFTARRVGSCLLAWAEQTAAAAGATVLWLTPWVHNHRALAFYARRGYADHGMTYFTFEAESHENRVLAKRLPPPARSRPKVEIDTLNTPDGAVTDGRVSVAASLSAGAGRHRLDSRQGENGMPRTTEALPLTIACGHAPPFSDDCSVAGEEDPGACLDMALVRPPAACGPSAAAAAGMALAGVLPVPPHTATERDEP